MVNVVTPLPIRTASTTPTTTTAPHAMPATAPRTDAALTTAEIAALALSLAHLGTGPQAATARQGLRRLLEASPEAELDLDDTIVTTLSTLTASPDARFAERAAVVASAITERRVVHVRYRDAKQTVSTRNVEPVTCLVHLDHWYLVGWCQLRRGIRAFRFDRILAIYNTDVPAPAHPAKRFLPFQRRTR